MKTILLFSLLSIAAISCTKSVQLRENVSGDMAISPGKETTTRLASLPELSAFFSPANVQVTVKPEPYVICESYQDGASAKPCNIFINFNLVLSQPVNDYLRVEIERSNVVTADKPDPAEGDSSVVNPPVAYPGAKIWIVVPPNKTTLTFRTALSNQSNTSISENEFRIARVGFYTPVN